ncbi:hypothetical protein DPMN_095447 [Dreissena polymorpha]|uniref:Uncharacterized protein n=1 Tax=Dreissena polymorpha TaxID=45954 RepID=A0A9D4L9G7_DREPO|nr:hypothetical protein DPMN_095447 [Dreissena polymorpha]
MPQSQLKKALDLTVEECVSFVGVDINTCSQCLLRYGSLCGYGHQHMQPVPA